MTDKSEEDEYLGSLLKAAYSPVSPPPGIKECLRERLSFETAGAHIAGGSLLERPRVWLPVTFGVISGAIGYGAWLSLHLVPMLMQ